MSTVASIWGCNLGDTLWVSPLAIYEPNLVVQMLGNDKRSRLTAPILDGLCKVEFVEKTEETKKAKIRDHVTQQILTAYGHGGKPSIPKVILKPEEIFWAIDFLKSKGVKDPRNAIVFINQNSGTKDPNNPRAAYVRPHPDHITSLARFWVQGGRTQILQFGPSADFYDKRDVFEPIENATCIRGLTVRELASVYHVVGRMIGSDTGDKHLMLAVGGRVACLVPRDSIQWGYRHFDLLYNKTCWGDEKPRLRYALHEDYSKFMNTELFEDKCLWMANPDKV